MNEIKTKCDVTKSEMSYASAHNARSSVISIQVN